MSELNFLIFILLGLLFMLLGRNALNLLIVSEFFWITLYALAVLLAITMNNVQVIALVLFFLVFSAVEISVGLVLLVSQSTFLNNLGMGGVTSRDASPSQFN